MIDPTVIAVASAMFAAIAGILARVLLQGIPAKNMLGVNFYILGLSLLLLSPWYFRLDFSLVALSLIILIATIDLFANFFYFKTFERTDAGTALPLLSLAPLFTFVCAWLFLGEAVPITTLLLCTLVIAGLAAFSIDWQDFGPFNTATLYPALASSFLFGISAIPTKFVLDTIDATNAPTLFLLRAFLIATLAIPFFGLPVHSIKPRQYVFITLRGLTVIAQWVLLYYALTLGSAGVVVTLSNITPAFVFVLGVLFLREQATWRKGISAGLVVALSAII